MKRNRGSGYNNLEQDITKEGWTQMGLNLE